MAFGRWSPHGCFPSSDEWPILPGFPRSRFPSPWLPSPRLPSPRLPSPRRDPDGTEQQPEKQQQNDQKDYERKLTENKQLERELARYRKENKKLLKRFEALEEQLKQQKIRSFEDLAEREKEAKNALVSLANEVAPEKMTGLNIGFFGLTSTGKSTMLNALIGEKVAETGYGETTTEITPYQGEGYTFWDVPGRNDELSYLTMDYISFFKGLKYRLILIQATLKENSSMMKLLDEINLDYDIIVNKFDAVPSNEQESFKEGIRREVRTVGLKHAKNIYFVSALNPNQFDWLAMVNRLTG